MVPYEAFLAEKPVVTTTDAGGPLEVVTDRVTGLVAEPRAEALAAAFARAQRRRRRSLGTRRPGDRRARHLGRDDRQAALVRVAYYSPLPPSRSGIADYSALLLPALAERMDVVVARPGRFRRDPKADIALYHVGNDPARARLDRRGARAAGRASSSCTSSSSTTSSPGSPSPAATSRATAPRSSARPGRRAALLGLRRPAGRDRAALGDAGAGVPARPRGARRTRPALIVHSRVRRGASRATPASPARSGRCRCRPGPCRTIAPAPIDGGPVVGCFGHVNESKRIPQLLRGVRALEPGRAPPARRLVVAAPARDRACRSA